MSSLIQRAEEILNIHVVTVVHEGMSYIITSDTGEGVFAYDSADFDIALDAAQEAKTEKYASFCEACTPEIDEDLARTVYAATGLQICFGGTCSRVVDFDEEAQ